MKTKKINYLKDCKGTKEVGGVEPVLLDGAVAREDDPEDIGVRGDGGRQLGAAEGTMRNLTFVHHGGDRKMVVLTLLLLFEGGWRLGVVMFNFCFEGGWRLGVVMFNFLF